MVGQQLGTFHIEEEIGRGGMGVVYRAVDSRLGRSVAIKVLPTECAHSADHRSRFEREARVLASLNHPNIAAIHGVEDFDGTCGLVLEYVPGETLAERIAKGRVAVNDALTIACRIAEALEAAHRKGVIHRDLKPANVKITPDHDVKVLDFGLAKVFGPAFTAAPSAAVSGSTETMTAAHTIAGTPAYMSPEQAQGKPLDQRSDLWSFGCVLFELLTRKRAFTGDTASDQIAAVLAKDPPWKALPHDLDPRISRLLHRCLEKDPHRRLRDAGDARLEIEDVLSGAPLEFQPAVRPRIPIWAAGTVSALLIGAGALGAWVWMQARKATPPTVGRFVIDLPETQRIVTSWNPTVLFTPDGSSIGFASPGLGTFQSYERRLADLETRPLAGGLKGLGLFSFSPDGKWTLLLDNATIQLKKASLGGGAPTLLTETDMPGRGDWTADGYIYITEKYPGAIVRMHQDGGQKEQVTTLDPERRDFVHKHAKVLPGGKALIFTSVSAGAESYDDARIEAFIFATKQRKVLVQGGFCPRYSPSGHIVYARSGSLYAVPFETRSVEVTGPPAKVVDGVLMSTNTGSAYFDVSSTGSLAYAQGRAEGGDRTIVWVDRHGHEQPFPLPPRSYLFPRISPDQKTLAIEIEGATHNLYTYGLARGVLAKITMDGLSHAPVWTPDGQNLCYRSWKAGRMTMWRMPADRSGPDVQLADLPGMQSAVALSPDGRLLTFNQMAGTVPGTHAFVLALDNPTKPLPIAVSSASEGSAKFSPDGKWVVYCSGESGRPEVYIQPWPGPGPRIQVSSEGGLDPLWTRKGDEIFYRNADKMMVVPVSIANGVDLGKPRMLWQRKYAIGMSSSCGAPGVSSGNYDITRDGQRFIMIKENEVDATSTKLVVVLNWTRELNARQ